MNEAVTIPMKYDLVTRWLHAGIAVLVAIQVICSGIMEVPKPEAAISPVGFSFFRIHETSGLIALIVVSLHWIWNLTGHMSGGWGHFFPWFSPEQKNRFYSDLKSIPRWIQGGIPAQEDETISLAGAVHGLGLLVVSAMAITGTIIYFGLGPDGATSSFIAFVVELHGFLAGFLYAYLVGHVGMALVHWWLGHGILGRMFNLLSQ